MNDFPIIETIDDVLPFVKERTEFVVGERPWGTFIDYIVTLPDSFETPQARECRGIKFGLDGRLIARPYHKFFNFGEPLMRVEDLAAAGRFNDSFIILDKLDGSMIHPIFDETGTVVQFCTRMGITTVSQQAKDFVVGDLMQDHTTKAWYEDFCHDLMVRGITPMFEWCTRKNRIVIDYPQDQLVLTAIRVNRTGEYLTYRKMRTLAEPYKIPMVSMFDGEWNGIIAFEEMVHDIEEAEGYVLRWDDGTMGKTKGEWYLQIHKAKDHIAHEKRLIALILEDNIDDVLPFLLPSDYERVTAYRKDFWETIDKMVVTLETRVGICRKYTDACGWDAGEAKKWFATKDVPQYGKGSLAPLKGLLFMTWDGKVKTRDNIIAFLRRKFSLDVVGAKRNGDQNMVDDLRDAYLLPEKNWLDY